jgi:hypothetical protein
MFTQFYDPGLEPVTGFGRYFAASIYVIGAATLFFALLMLIRPVIIRQPATEEEREHARRIVEAYGRSSLAPHITWDKPISSVQAAQSLRTPKGAVCCCAGRSDWTGGYVSSVTESSRNTARK